MTDLPNQITFSEPPFGTILIRNGQFGYKKDSRTRLRRSKTGDIYFEIKNSQKYIQDTNDEKVFKLQN